MILKYPIGYKKGQIILSLLIFLITIRVGKSVLIYFFKAPLIIIAIGIFAFLCMGPTLQLLVKRYIFKNKFDYTYSFHYIPPILYMCSIFIHSYKSHNLLWHNSYKLILAYVFFYLLCSFYYVFKYYKNETKLSIKERNLLIVVVLGTFFIWLAYFLHSLPGDDFSYLLGPVMYSLIVYLSLFYVLKYYKYIKQVSIVKKYSDQSLSEEERKVFLDTLLKKMIDDKLFLNPEITLISLAESLNIRHQTLSRIINEYFNCNFNDFINKYRIEHSCEILKKDRNIKIIAISIDSGFNNLSTFNSAFKKHTGKTPTQYKNDSKI